VLIIEIPSAPVFIVNNLYLFIRQIMGC